MSETQFSPRDDRCAHDFSVSMSLRDGISPTRVRDCGFECGGRLRTLEDLAEQTGRESNKRVRTDDIACTVYPNLAMDVIEMDTMGRC
jgi:hypothetical protein